MLSEVIALSSSRSTSYAVFTVNSSIDSFGKNKGSTVHYISRSRCKGSHDSLGFTPNRFTPNISSVSSRRIFLSLSLSRVFSLDLRLASSVDFSISPVKLFVFEFWLAERGVRHSKKLEEAAFPREIQFVSEFRGGANRTCSIPRHGSSSRGTTRRWSLEDEVPPPFPPSLPRFG